MSLSVLFVRSTGQQPLDFDGTDLSDATVQTVSTESAALDAVGATAFDCVVVDQHLDTGDGLGVLAGIRRERPSLPVVLCTDQPDGELASEATRYDVTAYHVRGSDEPVEQRVAGLLTDDASATQEDPEFGIVSDGASATHGTPFVQIAETVNDAIVTIDSDSYVQFANTGLADLTGYDREQLVGESFTTVLPERFREAHEAGVQRYLDTGERSVDWDYIELAVQHREGHEIPVAVSFAEFERDGETYFTGLIRDISERRSMANSLESLHEVITDSSLSSMAKIERVIDDHRERLGVSLAFLGRFDDDGVERFPVAVGDHELAADGTEIPLEETYCQYTVERGEPLIATDVADDETIPDDIQERHGLACYLGHPVTVDGESYGTLCFADDDPTDQTFDDADVAFLELLAEWVGNELTQKRQREQLREERQRVENILERIDDAFFAVDENAAFTYFNRRAEELLEVSREQVLGEHIWDVYGDAFDTVFREQFQQAIDTQEPVTFEEYYPPLEKWFRVSVYPSENGLSVYLDDVTDRREYTRALTEMHEQTQRLGRARTREAVAETIVDATAATLGYELCAVRIREDGQLRPLAVSGETAETIGNRPAYGDDEWAPGQALQTGETVVVENPETRAQTTDEGPDPEQVSGIASSMYVPIEEYGVLSVGTQGSFDGTDQSIAELLASHAALAFERVERERELRTNEAVLETVQGMVFALDTDGDFELLTDPLADWLGYGREALLDAGLDAVLGERERETFDAAIEELRAGSAESTIVETELTGASGDPLPAEVELSIAPDDGLFEGTIGVVRDLTELLEARRQLEAERDRFRYLFDNLPDAVSEARFEDGEPIVQSVNDAFEDIFGYDAADVIGNSLNDYILTAEMADTGAEIDRAAADGEAWQGEVQRLTASGRRYFLFRGVPYTTPEGDVYGFGIYTDITERKQRERRLQVLTRLLRHNLRNDLSVVLGYAELLEEETTDDRLANAAAEVSAGIDDIVGMSEDVRDIQRVLETGGGTEHTTTLSAVVERAIGAVREDHPEATVTADVPDVPVTVDRRLHLALSHLAENAIEHARETPQVRVSAHTDDDTVVVTVADDGPGIPDEEWAVVSGDTEITQLSHGSGLGLWAVKWVADSYGGRMERVETALGGGAVRLWLPGIGE